MKRDSEGAHRGLVSLWGHLMVFCDRMFCFYNENRKEENTPGKNVYKETLRDSRENSSTLFL